LEKFQQTYADQIQQANNTESEESAASQKLLADARPNSTASEKCQPSPAYAEIIDLVLNKYYDPAQIKDADKLANKYDCQIKNDTDAVSFADKAIEELHLPYTDVFPKAELDVLTSDLAGKYYGIGVSVINNMRPGGKSNSRVADVAPGGAADAAGIKPGDLLLKIDGNDVTRLSHQEISSVIRSEKADPIAITVDRNGEEITFDKVERRLIQSQSVREPIMKDGIVHIGVKTFAQEDTSDELKAAIEKFPDAKGYVIDLRHNTGGLVQEALKSLSLFMSEGKLMTERQRLDQRESGLGEGEIAYSNKDFTLTKNRIEVSKTFGNVPGYTGMGGNIKRHKDLVDKPVVILTDEMTASASEIFAAAMKDHNEATLIGTKTFGKGIGQDVYQGLPEGSGVAVTTMRIFSPNKNWVGDGANERYGIKPDVEVKKDEDAAEVAHKFLLNKIAEQEKQEQEKQEQEKLKQTQNQPQRKAS
jgi:carboxyl-terminal processing protease